MSRPMIAALHRTKHFSPRDLLRAAKAITRQTIEDLAPEWGASADVVVVPEAAVATPRDNLDHFWGVVELLDHADQAAAMGYHFERSGKPWGRVFVQTTLEDGGCVETTFGHEVLEMLCDPFVNSYALGPDGRFYALESCDAPEDDQFSYKAADGTPLSDFVTPRYFDPHAPKGSRLDFCGHISKPFEVLEGGYLAYYDPATGDFAQVGPAGKKHDHVKATDRHSHSRFRRRRGDHR